MPNQTAQTHMPGPGTRFVQQACGCKISHDPASPFFPIVRCPLHAAAPEGLEAALLAAPVLDCLLNGDGSPTDEEVDHALTALNTFIRKATGGQP